MEVLLLSGFVLGFAGSVHCVGMCGPLALSLPFQHFRGWQKALAIGGYHFGRISSYMIIGIIAGVFGRGLNWFGLTQILSIVLGSFIVLSVLLPRLFTKLNLSFLNGFKRWQITTMQQMLQKRSAFSMYFFGVLNGFLPCGLVYTAVAASLVAHTITESILFMGSFGLGTVPAMLLIVIAAQSLTSEFRLQIRRWIPVLSLIVGILLILRGLNLDIPFVSPYLHKAIHGADAIECGH
ncbi:sulfite exporter TauE/SafE family protein [Sediminibacterium sp. TEGAF015]|uniref:sulfite exporter TauE/SafE family protein n=1 Tax=Sediminibacterium sp. TEGAF015 TaxID=575378 RepID=UPI002208B2B0|nr:sulfite exporter TauE/SafE family protein [Sediminibacterium sp. TEGAF015]BDQ10989.1 membrane protein [Sediminibacterium sp. TEGAF015]